MWRRKARTILTVLGIVIGILALTVLAGLSARMNQQANGAVEWFGNSITVFSEDGNIFGGGTYFERSKVEEIRALPGVGEANGTLTFPMDETGFDFTEIHGYDLTQSYNKIESLKLAEGRLLEEGDTGKAVIGSTLAENERREVGR